MSVPDRDTSYTYPSGRAEQHIGITTRYAGDDVRQVALGKLIDWDEPEVAIILGLVPDDGRVI